MIRKKKGQDKSFNITNEELNKKFQIECSNYLKSKYYGEKILDFWNLNSTCFPTLSTMARILLAATAKSVPSVRFFQQVGIKFGIAVIAFHQKMLK